MLKKVGGEDSSPLRLPTATKSHALLGPFYITRKELWLAGPETWVPRPHFTTDEMNMSKTLPCSGSQFITRV